MLVDKTHSANKSFGTSIANPLANRPIRNNSTKHHPCASIRQTSLLHKHTHDTTTREVLQIYAPSYILASHNP